MLWIGGSLIWRFHIKTPFTFWDMRPWGMWKVCLQIFRSKRICSNLAYFLRNLRTSRANNLRIQKQRWKLQGIMKVITALTIIIIILLVIVVFIIIGTVIIIIAIRYYYYQDCYLLYYCQIIQVNLYIRDICSKHYRNN